MKRSFVPIIISISILLAVVSSCKTEDKKAAPVEKFGFNLEQGKNYEYSLHTEMTQEIMGQSTNIAIRGRYGVQINEVDTNVSKLTVTYDQFSMDIKAGGMTINVDTDKPITGKMDMQKDPSGFMARLFNGIKGKSFSMTVGKRGDIQALSGFNGIVRNMLDSLDLDENQKFEAQLSLEDQFSDAAAREQFTQMFQLYPPYIEPGKGIEKGMSWTVHSTRGGNRMPLRYSTKYTITRVDDDKVYLNSVADIKSDEATVTGTENGFLEVDRKSGLLLNSEFEQQVKVLIEKQEMEIKGKGRISGRKLD